MSHGSYIWPFCKPETALPVILHTSPLPRAKSGSVVLVLFLWQDLSCFTDLTEKKQAGGRQRNIRCLKQPFQNQGSLSLLSESLRLTNLTNGRRHYRTTATYTPAITLIILRTVCAHLNRKEKRVEVFSCGWPNSGQNREVDGTGRNLCNHNVSTRITCPCRGRCRFLRGVHVPYHRLALSRIRDRCHLGYLVLLET